MLRTFFYLSLFLGKIKPQCEDRDFCKYNNDKIVPSCYCDVKCNAYEDCCKEYILSHFQTNQTTPLEPDYVYVPQNQSCVVIREREDRYIERFGAFMIDKCLESGDKCPIQKNEMEVALPVSFNDNIYVNAECALCNNVNTFDVWSIVYEISQTDKIVSFSESGQTITDQNILQLIKSNENVKGYYLQPPEDVNPRYCSVAPLWTHRERVTKDYASLMQHQNIVGCNHTFFKNFDICSQAWCCGTLRSSCYHLHLPSLWTNDGKGISTGELLVLMKFETHGTKNPKKVKTGVPKITYMNRNVGIVFKIYHSTTETGDLDECVFGLMMYLRNTEFRLVPGRAFYQYGSLGNNTQIAFTLFRENARLSDVDLTQLLRLKIYFHIELRPSGKWAIGEIRVLKVNESLLASFDIQGKLRLSTISKNEIDKPVTKMFHTCKNVSLILTRGTTGGHDLDDDCMDKIVANNAQRSTTFSAVLVVLIITMLKCTCTYVS